MTVTKRLGRRRNIRGNLKLCGECRYQGNRNTVFVPNSHCAHDDSAANRAAAKSHYTGVLFPRSATSFKNITDGTAKTILVGERDYQSTAHGDHEASNWIGSHGAGWHTEPFHYNWVTIFDEANSDLQINDYDPAEPANKPDCWPVGNCGNPYGVTAADSWSSQHPGGAQFVFCDGSVRFLTETISDTTFASLCARGDGNVVGNF